MNKKQIKERFFEQVLCLFKNNYQEPMIFTPTQKEIIKCIAFQPYNRVGVICPTQYGKSTACACGILLRTICLPEKFVVVGGTKSKAEIIMGYIIDHLFDDEIFTSQLKIDTSIEKLKRERRKDHLSFKKGGEIKIVSAEYRNKKTIRRNVNRRRWKKCCY